MASPGFADSAAVFVISVAAELAGMHPQTLRQYDRLGLVSPHRTAGRGRRYSTRDIEQLREVQRLSQEEGVNLEGIKRILDLENQVHALRSRLAEVEADRREASRPLTPQRRSSRPVPPVTSCRCRCAEPSAIHRPRWSSGVRSSSQRRLFAIFTMVAFGKRTLEQTFQTKVESIQFRHTLSAAPVPARTLAFLPRTVNRPPTPA